MTEAQGFELLADMQVLYSLGGYLLSTLGLMAGILVALVIAITWKG